MQDAPALEPAPTTTRLLVVHIYVHTLYIGLTAAFRRLDLGDEIDILVDHLAAMSLAECEDVDMING
jgi:hypothetical protein